MLSVVKPKRFAAVNLPAGHPDVQKSYKNAVALPSGHVKVDHYYNAVYPSTHPNVDTLLANPSLKQMADWHPSVTEFTDQASAIYEIVASIPFWHENVTSAYLSNQSIPNGHLKFQDYFANILPEGHSNIDMLMRNPSANLMPLGHPYIGLFLSKRTQLRPGHFLSIYLLSTL